MSKFYSNGMLVIMIFAGIFWSQFGYAKVCWKDSSIRVGVIPKYCKADYEKKKLFCFQEESIIPHIPTECREDKEKIAGLCYSACPEGYNQLGPVCLKKCTGDTPVDCGGLCGSSTKACLTTAGKMTLAVVNFAGKIAALVATSGATAAAETAALAVATFTQDAAIEAAAGFLEQLLAEIVLKAGEIYTTEKVKQELKVMYPELPDFLLKDLAAAAVELKMGDKKTRKAMLLKFARSLDITGITQLVSAFKKEIC